MCCRAKISVQSYGRMPVTDFSLSKQEEIQSVKLEAEFGQCRICLYKCT